VRGIVPNLQECVLDNILGACWVANNSDGGGVGEPPVPVIEFGKRFLVALSECARQVWIVQSLNATSPA